jgi:hypothetical protein
MSLNKHLFLDYETVATEVCTNRHWVAPDAHASEAIEDPRPETTAETGGGRHIDREIGLLDIQRAFLQPQSHPKSEVLAITRVSEFYNLTVRS